MSHEARRLLRSHRYGALSTISKKLNGFPFGSITPYMTDHDGSLIILISALAEHSKNILHDARVSLITHNQSSPDIQMQGRVTVVGNAHRIGDQQQVAGRYLRHFSEAAELLTLDFSFFRIAPVAIRHIGGVGRIHWLRMDDYAIAQASDFTQQEEALLDDINVRQRDHLQRTLLRDDFQVIGADCDGLDLRSGVHHWRMDFATPLTDPFQLQSLTTLQYIPA